MVIHETNRTTGDGSPEDSGGHYSELITGFVRAFVHTEEFREIVRTALPEVLEVWAGKSRIKRALGRPVARSISRSFQRRESDADVTPVSDLCSRPEFARMASEQLPLLINSIMHVACAASENISRLSAEEKSRFISELIGGLDMGTAGRVITGMARIVNEAHASDQLCITASVQPGLQQFLQNVDFGELREALDRSAEDIVALVATVNDSLWQYPAKVVCLLSMIPAAINIITGALVKTAEPMNRQAPDLLADVLLSVLREIRGQEIGKLINEWCELIRKVITGSVLIGEYGKPQLQEDISSLLDEILESIDIPLLFKVQAQLAETGELTRGAFLNLLEDHPEMVRFLLMNRFRKRAARIRSAYRNAETIESIFSNEEVAEEIAKGIAEVDPLELAETVNLYCSLFNSVREKSPDIVRDTVSPVISSLDEYEAGRALRLLVGDVVQSLKPVAHEIMPPFIRGIAELLTPDDNEDSSELQDALAALQKAIGQRGEMP